MTNAQQILTASAWELIGFGGNLNDIHPDAPDSPASVRTIGGRTLYEAVDFCDATRGNKVRLARLEMTPTGFRQVNRYVDGETQLEVVFG